MVRHIEDWIKNVLRKNKFQNPDNFKEIEKLLKESFEYYKTHGNRKTIAITYSNLGIIYKKLGKHAGPGNKKTLE